MNHALKRIVPYHNLRPAMKRIFPLLLPLSLSIGGCVSVKTEPIEVKPIHITVDVNVKVEKALDDFFGDIDKKAAAVNATKP